MNSRDEIKCLQNDLVIRWANHIAGFYGHPVYLVGSQLYKDDPRDVDVVCVIPDSEFVSRFINQSKVIGNTDYEKCQQWGYRYRSGLYDESNWAWARDVSHKSIQGMKATMMQIDLKVYPQSYQVENFEDKPIMKLCESPYESRLFTTKPDQLQIERMNNSEIQFEGPELEAVKWEIN